MAEKEIYKTCKSCGGDFIDPPDAETCNGCRRSGVSECILQVIYPFRHVLNILLIGTGNPADTASLFDELKATGWRPEGEGE